MFTAVKTYVVLCVVMQRCGLIGGLQYFRQTYCPHCSPVMGSSIFCEALAPTYQKTTHYNDPEAHSMDSIFLLLLLSFLCSMVLQPKLSLGYLVLKFLDHTQLDTHTPNGTSLNEWSAHCRGFYLCSTQQPQETNIHALSRIQTCNHRN